jgi:hypothetical protein
MDYLNTLAGILTARTAIRLDINPNCTKAMSLVYESAMMVALDWFEYYNLSDERDGEAAVVRAKTEDELVEAVESQMNFVGTIYRAQLLSKEAA